MSESGARVKIKSSPLEDDPTSSGQEKAEEIVMYPSARLGAISRKRNEIHDLMTSRTAERVAEVEKFMVQLYEKRDNFIEACVQQETRPSASAFEIEELIAWKNTHLEHIDEFCKSVKRWIKPVDKPVERMSSASASDVCSNRSSGKSTSSSTRMKLLERKIKLETERKRLSQCADIERKRLKAKLLYEETQFKLNNEARTSTRRRRNFEIRETIVCFRRFGCRV